MIKTLLPLLIIVAVILVIKFIIKNKQEDKKEVDLSVFVKKQYLFDAASEFNLFKTLTELFGDKYYIFPQVNYSHLIEPRKSTYQEERKNRSRIDRKSADFVMCDKDRIVPKLIIELDGYVHNYNSKQTRDEFIDELTKIVDLPILHLKTNNVDKEFIRSEINKKLGR